MKDFLMKTIFCLLVFASCKSAITNEENVLSSLNEMPDDALVTPYTDMTTSENIRSATNSDPDVVNWKVARFFAVIEKVSFEDYYPQWKDAKVSQKPVLIYYPEKDKIKFYEFRVIKDDIEIGSITCNASKKEGRAIVYVSEMAHKVTAKVAKELVASRGNKKLSAVNYPRQFVLQDGIMEGTQSGMFKDGLTLEKLNKEDLFVEMRADEMLKKADDEMLKKLEITKEMKDEILATMKEREEIDASMWETIDKLEYKIIAMSDEEIEARLEEEKLGKMKPQYYEYEGSERGEWWRYILPKWKDKGNWDIKGSTWCGPACLTFVALGLGKDANCSLVPLVYNSAKIRKLYEAFERKTGTGPVVFSTLNYALESLTGYHVKPILLHRWQDAYDHMNNTGLPAISLRTSWVGHDAGLHYRLVIGASVSWVVEHHCFWWFGTWPQRWTRSYDNYWYLMRDNNVDRSYSDSKKEDTKLDFWEIAGRYYQCQLALVERP